MLFLTYLAEKLDQDRPSWREDTIIQMDNASYNQNDEQREHMSRLGMRVMFTAPYSYDASPCELFFASFKQGMIVKVGEAAGKK